MLTQALISAFGELKTTDSTATQAKVKDFKCSEAWRKTPSEASKGKTDLRASPDAGVAQRKLSITAGTHKKQSEQQDR